MVLALPRQRAMVARLREDDRIAYLRTDLRDGVAMVLVILHRGRGWKIGLVCTSCATFSLRLRASSRDRGRGKEWTGLTAVGDDCEPTIPRPLVCQHEPADPAE
jgi:hypothetical protein